MFVLPAPVRVQTRRRGKAGRMEVPDHPSTDERPTIERVLTTTSTWAVVGASPDPHRASYGVGQFLRANGFRVIPVNPAHESVWGEPCYPSLAEVPEDVDVEVVDIFRRADQAGAHVDEAILRGATAVWLQIGVVDEAAALRARTAGLDVVMDRCPKIELPRIKTRRAG